MRLDAATARDEARDLCAFIDASPTPWHAVAEVVRRLEADGFVAQSEADAFAPGAGKWFVVRDGSVVAWTVPADAPPTSGFRIVAAHTDSPNLRVKPKPDRAVAGFRQVAVEMYGGALLTSWLDRDLGIAGRAAVRGSAQPVLFRIDRPIARLPHLAIHLDRDVLEKGLVLNRQQHLVPVLGLGDGHDGFVAGLLARAAGVAPADLLGWDACLFDLVPSTLSGVEDEFVSAPRLDNLNSAWCGLTALVRGDQGVRVLSLFDHEEVGSTSSVGAGSTLLGDVLERSVIARGGSGDDQHRARAASYCVSADMAHATHPNYPERHEPGHWVTLNAGPVIKWNPQQRYATDARTAAVFDEAADRAGVPLQRYAHRGDLPCGSTIGPITAAGLGIPVVDVGNPQLAMHSCRELAGSLDPALMVRAMAAFYEG